MPISILQFLQSLCNMLKLLYIYLNNLLQKIISHCFIISYMQLQSETIPSSEFTEPSLASLIQKQPYKRCLVQIPLEFEFQPIEIISKQLTKFNTASEYRVVYLGPRWLHNHHVHKTISGNEQQPQVTNPQQFGLDRLKKYKIDMTSKQKAYIMRVNNHYLFEKNTVYYRAFQGANPTINLDEELKFDSHFQSGNLDCAIRVTKSEYDLFLRIDSNTRGHVLWYYFSITNKEKQKVKINLCNIMKHNNLYKKNMKPYVFSVRKNRNKNISWEQKGQNVILEEKELRYSFVYEKISVRKLSSLSFEYQFQYENDQVFFAYCIPYTYSLLLHQIEKLKQITSQTNVLEVETLGTSLLGVDIPVLKITDKTVSFDKKKVIFVTGRIHPSESCGSVMVSGLMNHLCSSEAADLRKQSIFFIIPMMNPDGVIMGNYRTGVSGVDLNRVFHKMNKEIYSEVYYLKTLVKKLMKIQPIFLYLDFHGHSSKKNAFSYGPGYKISDAEYYKSKLLSKLTANKTSMFRYYSCTWRITEGKKDTARSVFFYEYNIQYTYTIEASNGSYYDQELKLTLDFNYKKWEDVGRAFGTSVNQFIELLHFSDRKQMVYTAGRLSKKMFPSPKKVIPEEFMIFQKSVELGCKTSIKGRYHALIEEIKNDERHKKEDEDSEVDSDDDDPEDIFPKAKLVKLGRSILENFQIVKEDEELNIKNEESIRHKHKKVDSMASRKYQFMNKTRRIKLEKSQIQKQRKDIINKMYETNLVISQKHPQHQSDLISHRLSEGIKEKATMMSWKGQSQYLRKINNKRMASAGCARNVVPKVQMSLEVDEGLRKAQEGIKQFKRYLQISHVKSRSRTRSLSHTQRQKQKAHEPVESFLYPQVFHFDQFIEENNKKLSKLNKEIHLKKPNSISKKILYAQHYKTSCPSAFYKIKQSLSKRKEESQATLQKGVIIMNIRMK